MIHVAVPQSYVRYESNQSYVYNSSNIFTHVHTHTHKIVYVYIGNTYITCKIPRETGSNVYACKYVFICQYICIHVHMNIFKEYVRGKYHGRQGQHSSGEGNLCQQQRVFG